VNKTYDLYIQINDINDFRNLKNDKFAEVQYNYETLFYKCIHYKDELGIFVYYKKKAGISKLIFNIKNFTCNSTACDMKEYISPKEIQNSELFSNYI
jgi:hypothetical protein